MAVSGISIQPDDNEIMTAYNPINFGVVTDETTDGGVAPTCYCDIYYSGSFYKTIAKTIYESLVSGNSAGFLFDIEDIIQEVFFSSPQPVGGSALNVENLMGGMVQCKFRSSDFDSNGFLVPDGAVPIQGTGTLPSSGGDGLASNEFFVFNGAVLHTDNRDVESHLTKFMFAPFDDGFYPATRRPMQYFIGKGQSDYYYYIGSGGVDCSGDLTINYTLKDGTAGSETNSAGSGSSSVSITDIEFVQEGTLARITFSFSGTADELTFNYSIDGGATLNTSATTIEISGLDAGDHSIEITPVAGCSEGTGDSLDFTMADAEIDAEDDDITVSDGEVVDVSVADNDTVPCDAPVYSIVSFDADYLSSCTINASTGVATLHFKTPLNGGDDFEDIVVATYKVTCPGLEAEANIVASRNFNVELSSTAPGVTWVDVEGIPGYTFPGGLTTGWEEDTFQTGFTDSICVTLSGTAPIPIAITLEVNGIVVQTINIPAGDASGTYCFDSRHFLSTDSLRIDGQT